MAKMDNFHNQSFDDATKTKLELYERYLAGWLAVFLNVGSSVRKINIFDFFAGPGENVEGCPGSPRRALEKIRGALEGHHVENPPHVHLYLNEKDGQKFAQLRTLDCPQDLSPHLTLHLQNKDVSELFDEWVSLMREPNVANLVFLDQFGVKQVPKDRFQTLCQLLYTDFLFFLSSSYISRFRTDEAFNTYLPLEYVDKTKLNNSNAHQLIAKAYEKWIPSALQKEYHLGSFSLKKKSGNIHGLIFGSGHILGIYKFIEVCWHTDPIHGEANYEMEGISRTQECLFQDMNVPTKERIFNEDLEYLILNGTLRTNVDVFKFTVKHGFLPTKHACDVLQKMKRDKKISFKGQIPLSYDTCWKRWSREQNCVTIELIKR